VFEWEGGIKRGAMGGGTEKMAGLINNGTAGIQRERTGGGAGGTLE